MNNNPKKKPLGKKQAKSSFPANEIATSLSLALNSDLAIAEHEYGNEGVPPTRVIPVRAFQIQSENFLKKYLPAGVDQSDLETKAFNSFIRVNEDMLTSNLSVLLRTDHLRSVSRIHPHHSDEDRVFLRARALVHFVLGRFSSETWANECKHSSGTSQGVPFLDTSMDRKFSYPISTSERALNPFMRFVLDDPMLSKAVSLLNGTPLTNSEECFAMTEASRADTVDKDLRKKRFISIESTAQMFLQQGLMKMMYTAMDAVGLDVETLPDSHQVRARLSSLTSSEATIDWSEASNRVCYEIVRWITPPDWFRALDLSRSTHVCLPGIGTVEQQMFATMGNATTFPIETLVFWAFGHAVRLTEQNRSNSLYPEEKDLLKVSVFGDDCIIPSAMVNPYIDFMESIGMVVNEEKSFSDRWGFRESCGGDYLTGTNVRAFNLKAPPSSKGKAGLESWLYTIGNAIIPRYIQYFGSRNYVYDKRFLTLYFQLFRRHGLLLKVVPDGYPDDCGLRISNDLARLERCYDIKLSNLYINKHGTIKFLFLRFVYPTRVARSQSLEYASWLKRPVQSKRKNLHVRPHRANGGYVTAKGLTAHWTVPGLTYRGQ